MKDKLVFKTYPAPEVNIREIKRYMRSPENSDITDELIKECLYEAKESIKYTVCFCEFKVEKCGDVLDLGFCKTSSKDIAKNLKNADTAVLFAATVGIGIDRLVAKYGRISPLKSLCFDAVGSERIESLCDAFNGEIKLYAKENKKTAFPRFSPGYGDFSIEVQKDILYTLDAQKKLGITLSDSLMMTPSKSVTGLIGLGNGECGCAAGCELCSKTDCEFRR